MSQAIVDDEICSYSLFMAKNLISQVLTNLDYNENERLDTEVPSQTYAIDSPNLEMSYNPKFDSFAARIQRLEPTEECKAISEIFMGETMKSVVKEELNEISSPRSYDEEDLDEVDEDIEVGHINTTDPHMKVEGSISNIFDKPNNAGESSMFPFSFLGADIEAIIQKHSREGFLFKKSSNVFLGWQKRYFEVRGFKIYYSKSKENLRDRKEVRCINLFVNPCTLVELKGQSFQISIEGIKKKLRLKASSVAEAKQWTDFFQDVFKFVEENSSKVSKYITRKREKLLKIDVLTEEEFLEQVETGDILLFKSIHMVAKLQRTFTYSKYDHVGIAVRAFDDVYLYDSVYEQGVQLTNWKDFKRKEYYMDYSRIAYRKLEINDKALKAKIQENLFNFVVEHTGKKYDISLKKLLRWNSTSTIAAKEVENAIKNNQPPPNPKASQEGFFCSELVAAAYKSVGLLNPFVASSRYLPVSFSQKKGMKLLNDAGLSNEFSLVLTDNRRIR